MVCASRKPIPSILRAVKAAQQLADIVEAAPTPTSPTKSYAPRPISSGLRFWYAHWVTFVISGSYLSLRIQARFRSPAGLERVSMAKHRRNARDQLKKLASAGCVLEPLIDLSANARRLHELYLAVHSNAPIRLVTLRETYLPALASAAGENFRCTVARRGDDILGFVTDLNSGLLCNVADFLCSFHRLVFDILSFVTDLDGNVHDVFGKGAGRWPTASAVFADVLDAQRALLGREPLLELSAEKMRA